MIFMDKKIKIILKKAFRKMKIINILMIKAVKNIFSKTKKKIFKNR
jgi:hypothetical protein